jgi:hypothetical protein
LFLSPYKHPLRLKRGLKLLVYEAVSYSSSFLTPYKHPLRLKLLVYEAVSY